MSISSTLGSDPDLTALQQRWSPAWKIWRARRSLGDGARDGDFVASRMDDCAGSTPTLMFRDPQDLHRALEAQAEAAGAAPVPDPQLLP